MKTRRLLNGKKVKELSKEVNWKMGSKCPGKYLIIDCEDGNLWVPGERREVGDVCVGFGKVTMDLVHSAQLALGCWEEIQKGQA